MASDVKHTEQRRKVPLLPMWVAFCNQVPPAEAFDWTEAHI